MLQLTGGEALVRALAPERIPFAFGIIGGKIAPFLKALSQQNSIRHIGARHESTSAYMATAVHAATGQIAVAFSELGPGTSNVVAGVTGAYNNRIPFLLITSNNQHAASYPSSGMFMELETQALLKPVVKWNATVHDGRRIPELVRRALREATSGRQGPVHIDVPQDILMRKHDYEDSEFDWMPKQYRQTSGPAPHNGDIDLAASLLAGAKRPVVIAGGGLGRSGGVEAARQIVTLLDSPALATQMGIGAFLPSMPQFIGHGGIVGSDAVVAALREADVVLAIGCRFSSWLWDEKGPLVRGETRLIHIDSDAGVLGDNARAEVAIHADAGFAVPLLAEALLLRHKPSVDVEWRARILQMYAAHRAKLDGLAAERSPVMHPAALAAEIGSAIPKDAFVTYDGGHTSFWSNDFTPVEAPRTRFHEPGMAQLGFGLPWAIALSLAHPGQPVFNITGDGAFGFTIQELDTARRYNTPVVNIVHNNALWGVVAAGQKNQGFDLGGDLSGTDYAAIARGFGCHGERVEKLEDVGPAIMRALSSGKPAVIDCVTRFVPHPMLPAFGKMGGNRIPA